MTLPASGELGFSDINTEKGSSSTASLALSWVKTKVKPVSTVNNLDQLHGKSWYQSNMLGACNNGNEGHCNCNCGNINCTNCLNCTPINCANCDTEPLFQTNCNCNPVYNCTVTSVSYNCNCNCEAVCACTSVCACACSDPKLKQFRNTYIDALAIVQKVRIHQFYWNKDAAAHGKRPGTYSIGVNAEELEGILPELVTSHNGVKSANYEALFSLTLAALQQLTNEIRNTSK